MLLKNAGILPESQLHDRTGRTRGRHFDVVLFRLWASTGTVRRISNSLWGKIPNFAENPIIFSHTPGPPGRHHHSRSGRGGPQPYEFCQYYQTHQHIKLHEKYQNTKIPLFSINKYRKIPQKINNPKNTFENPRVLLGPILHSYIGAILMYQEWR